MSPATCRVTGTRSTTSAPSPVVTANVDACDYLTELLRHTEELRQNPSEWMPWNQRDTLARLALPAAA